MVDIVIQRMDGREPLLLERAERLAEGFFRLDPSSTRSDGLDLQLGKTPADEITEADVHTINRTFVARSPLRAWENLFAAGPLPWLTALDPAWDLIALDDEQWERLRCRDALVDAFDKIRGPYRGQAVATKMLHLKRWRLVPVCDSLVAHQIRASSSTSTIELVEHIRGQGRANLHALSSVRSLVRILDALLWTSHPASLTYPLIGIIRDWTEPAAPTSYH